MQKYLETSYIFFLALFLIIFIFWKIYKSKKRIYVAKDQYLLTFGERKLFDAINSILGPNFYLCPKVRIADIVSVDIPIDKKEFWVNYQKISQKSVDFVIVKKSTFEPFLIIEIEKDSKNVKYKRLKTILLDRVFNDVGLPVLRISPERFYDRAKLKDLVFRSFDLNS